MEAEQPRVLIVEGNPELRRLEAAIVARSGCRSDLAGTSAEAFDAIRRHPPDVVILGSAGETDPAAMLLDRLGGTLSELAPRTVVLTTHVEDERLVRRAARTGVFAVIGEPFDVETLSAVIAKCAWNAGRRVRVTWIGMNPSAIVSANMGLTMARTMETRI
jgi:DNA-binding NtrC family response regulator